MRIATAKNHRLTFVAAGVLAAAALAGCSTTTGSSSKASAPSNRAELESQSTAALNRLYTAMPGTRELVSRAKGVLVCPAVLGGSFVVGVEHGRCVLRSGGTSRGYYSTTSGSVGWQMGGQSKSVIYVFSTAEAYDKFVNSKGWSVGGDATVAVGRASANGSVDTSTIQAPVSSFVLTNAGLEAGVSVNGTKISKIDM